jgi:hypothetical protein
MLEAYFVFYINIIIFHFDACLFRRCGEPLKKKKKGSEDVEDLQDVADAVQSPRTISRLRQYRTCGATLVADYEKARKNKGSFYIDHPGDPIPPHALSFAEGGWDFEGENGPVVRDQYLARDTRTGRP